MDESKMFGESKIIPEQKEKQKTKLEIDTEIEELGSKTQSLSTRQSELQSGLRDLLHGYGVSSKNLETFKAAKEALEIRISNPTLSEKLQDKFKSLLGNKANHSKEEFLSGKSEAEESKEYRSSGESLQDSVGMVAKNKESLRYLMDENLSFRANAIAGEDQSPREESIEKVTEEIKAIEPQIFQLNAEISKKREESYEAWKRGNPEEWATLQEKQRIKEEAVQKAEQEKAEAYKKTALFREFLQTKPEHREVVEVLQNLSETAASERTDTSYQAFRDCRKAYYEHLIQTKKIDMVRTVLEIPSDWKSTKDDEDFLSQMKVAGNINSDANHGMHAYGAGYEDKRYFDMYYPRECGFSGESSYDLLRSLIAIVRNGSFNASFFTVNMRRAFAAGNDDYGLVKSFVELYERMNDSAGYIRTEFCFPIDKVKDVATQDLTGIKKGMSHISYDKEQYGQFLEAIRTAKEEKKQAEERQKEESKQRAAALEAEKKIEAENLKQRQQELKDKILQ